LHSAEKRVTGILHNVGAPRATLKSAAQYKKYLRTLGFDNASASAKNVMVASTSYGSHHLAQTRSRL